MRVGDQAPGENHPGEHDTEFGKTVDPPTWRKLVLLAPKTDGSLAEVELLRPRWWVLEQNAFVGGVVDIHVPECGIQGAARVLGIEPCPQIAVRPGFRVVTGTFRHHAARMVEVHVQGLAEPIGTTPNHPFWSEDRQAFVRADELLPGEHLRAFHGTPIVRRITYPKDPEPVYNLEVQCSHVYHVADTGVLVHNGSAWKCYEDAVNTMLGAQSQFRYTAAVSGRARIADGVVNNVAGQIGVEAKYVGSWGQSIFNPSNLSDIARRKQWSLAMQMKDHAGHFANGVHYYTNSPQMKLHLETMAQGLGLSNVQVFLKRFP